MTKDIVLILVIIINTIIIIIIIIIIFIISLVACVSKPCSMLQTSDNVVQQKLACQRKVLGSTLDLMI